MTTLEKTVLEPPHRITELLYAHRATEVLKTALRLDVFSKLAEKPQTSAQLAEALSTDSRATELLLNALVALDLLQKDHDIFKPSDLARLYLVTSSNLYMGGLVTTQDDHLAIAWSKLGEVVESGKPLNQVNQKAKAEEFFPALAASIFPLNYGAAHSVATELRVEELADGAKVLDIAAGSAVWSLPLAERNKHLQVHALDFPAVLEVTRSFAEKHGVAQRYSYISGNWSDCKLDENAYDVVLLGHILHSEGAARSEALLKKSYEVLKPNGKLVIAEMISNNNFTGSAFVQLFALNMLIMTENGCIFSQNELEEMLRQAGFKDVVRPELPYWESDSPVMIATK